MTGEKELDGKVSIVRRNDGKIVMEIIDQISGIQFLTVEMSPDEFGRAVTGLSHRPANLRVRFLDFIGMKREVKVEKVPFRYGVTEEQIASALSVFETDGWKGRAQDYTNRHNRVGNDDTDPSVNVTFVRHVPVP